MYNSDALDVLLGGSLILILVLAAILLVYLVFYFVCLSKLFRKAEKKGWEAIVPYYNTWTMIEIAGLNWWYFLISIAGTVISFIGLEQLNWITTLTGWAVNFFIFYNLAKKMHKNPIGIAIGGVLVPGIMIIVMALSKDYQYDSQVEVSPNGPIGEDKSPSNNTTTPEKFCLGCSQKLKPNSLFCENCGKKID